MVSITLVGISIAIGGNDKSHGMQTANGENHQQSNNNQHHSAHKLIDVLVNHDKWSAVALYSSIHQLVPTTKASEATHKIRTVI